MQGAAGAEMIGYREAYFPKVWRCPRLQTIKDECGIEQTRNSAENASQHDMKPFTF